METKPRTAGEGTQVLGKSPSTWEGATRLSREQRRAVLHQEGGLMRSASCLQADFPLGYQSLQGLTSEVLITPLKKPRGGDGSQVRFPSLKAPLIPSSCFACFLKHSPLRCTYPLLSPPWEKPGQPPARPPASQRPLWTPSSEPLLKLPLRSVQEAQLGASILYSKKRNPFAGFQHKGAHCQFIPSCS